MNYTIIKELGQGGMATVYLAEHKLLKNKVALKVLSEELVRNKNIRNRFLSEARNLATMSHPNIIKVTDLIDEGDTVAFVMEHIDGETLKEYLERKGKLTDDEIRNIFTQMLEAVGYVHKKGLVHRDIKPSNFMIDKEGTVKLLDFGIAKNTDSSSAEYTQTGTGMQMGTPMYMSPEQITETKSVTALSDIYSLGVVLWQLVTGEKPYNTATLSNFQLQTKIVNEPLSTTGTYWDRFIKASTNKDPQNRYLSATIFKIDIENNPASSETNTEKTIIQLASVKADLDDKTISEPLPNIGNTSSHSYLTQKLTSKELSDIVEVAKVFVREHGYDLNSEDILPIFFNYFLTYTIPKEKVIKYPKIGNQLTNYKNKFIYLIFNKYDRQDIEIDLIANGLI